MATKYCLHAYIATQSRLLLTCELTFACYFIRNYLHLDILIITWQILEEMLSSNMINNTVVYFLMPFIDWYFFVHG